MKNIIFTYGSLRKDQYNYNRFKEFFKNQIEHLGTTEISGYKLYDLGSYPGLKESSNVNDKVIVDVLAIGDDAYRHIRLMELNANYKEISITIDGIEGNIYIYLGDVPEYDLVVEGDWNKYLSDKLKLESESITN